MVISFEYHMLLWANEVINVHYLDSGRLLTVSGRLLTVSGRLLTDSGRLLTYSGRLLTVSGFLDTAEKSG